MLVAPHISLPRSPPSGWDALDTGDRAPCELPSLLLGAEARERELFGNVALTHQAAIEVFFML